ncbi:CBS domain-containing protein [Salinicoccus bachuensis]|uniref:CBS domain-containing protein n=1 Tax=Salinicoccus bachuensis TaxID=3136731 RepID=A0ABZ3CGG5_9STAP
MQIIISHVNTDFDALASLIAANKLYPDAKVVIPNEQTAPVRQFLAIYRDSFEWVEDSLIDWSEVTDVILVDVASLSRLGNYTEALNEHQMTITVYDHHTPGRSNVKADYEVIEPVGATVTLLIEEIMKRKLSISPLEATLFGLGVYTDTGAFTFPNTTRRDFMAASFLLQQNMNLEVIQRFSDYKLNPEQQNLLTQLFSESKTYDRDGLAVIISAHQIDGFLIELATITDKLLELSGADAVLTVVKMEKHVHIVGRGNSNRIDLRPLLEQFDGGGHPRAGSATVRRSELDDVLAQVDSHLDLILKTAVTARDIMSSPVEMLPPETKIEVAGRLMDRCGYSGCPVVEDGKLIGVITRRDLDKADQHDLGHAPIKAFMSDNPVTIEPGTTIEEMEELIIAHNIGRLPVMEDGQPVGIVTRTNIIEVLHS